MGTLYVIATPIGNLDDISFRAVETLKNSDLIVCETPKISMKLLVHFDIKKPLESFGSNEKSGKVEKIFSLLKAGKQVALITDAGTPAIQDPGVFLVKEIRRQMKEEGVEIKISPIPGPSAFLAALSVSGFSVKEFIFLGFLPVKKGRQTMFTEIKEAKRTIVFYESTHRIKKTLEELSQVLNGRQVALGKELTKVFEETITGTADEVLEVLNSDPKKEKGEFVVVIEGK